MQLQALPIGLDRLVLPSEENRKKVYDLANQAPQPEEGGRRRWRKGELEFEGYMRHLDNAVSLLHPTFNCNSVERDYFISLQIFIVINRVCTMLTAIGSIPRASFFEDLVIPGSHLSI